MNFIFILTFSAIILSSVITYLTFNILLKNEVKNNVQSYNHKTVQLGNLFISLTDEIDLKILSTDTNNNSVVKLQGTLKESRQLIWDYLGQRSVRYETPKINLSENKVKIIWNNNNLKLEIKNEYNYCHTITWISKVSDSLEDCYYFDDAKWYGGPEITTQVWPVENLTLKEVPYVTGKTKFMIKSERYWLNSKGVYLFFDHDVPLFVDTNNHKEKSICFISKNSKPYRNKDENKLKYHICSLDNPRKAQEHAIRNFLGKPSDLPNINMIKNPIWSTWALYKNDVNEKNTISFAKEIVKNGFKRSNLEIDDNWETCYGTAEFDKTKFPNVKKIVKEIKDMNFKVTVWRHPYYNSDCPNYELYKNKDYFVNNIYNNVETEWWDGKGGIIDFTNPAAVKWFHELNNKLMKETGIDGFKFDSGEDEYTPDYPVFNGDKNANLSIYTSAYLKAVSYYNVNNLTEVRVVDRSQKLPIFIRMADKDSRWDTNNGLQALLASLLLLNIHGYSWVLPDMVGGNAYLNDVIDKELLIRWLQATTFMPSIQMSMPPWKYDAETVEICRKYIDLHYHYSDKIIEIMKKTVETGSPLNPPIWWISPTDTTAHSISTEYLLGEEILVAPVVEKGATKREIYLPEGYWKDANHPEIIYKGQQWLLDYSADLSTLPYFIKVEEIK
ncbi:myogenesis-regulating glycosidase-like [Lycorma delicatula]|uniref:myogenesis-regulating glycosidase-like n=1 Tax=Lycorma delicatula TaxID=130591 RepID=UPI003F516CE9